MEVQAKEETLTIKFNALVMPKVKWNAKDKKFEAVVNSIDFRHEYAKLMDEEGDTPEETKKLKRLHTARMSLREATEYIYGSLNDKDRIQFYYKNETMTLPKNEAEYYLKQYCGGVVTIARNLGTDKETQKPKLEFITGPHKHNIDNKQGYYDKNQLARFDREHIPLMVAEIVA